MLFTKKEEDHIKSMKNYQNHLQGGKAEIKRQKYQLLDKKNFDYNKYHVVSPFNKSRNQTCLTPQAYTDINELEKDKEQVENILKGCNRYHNQLARFCKF